jgi:hypothetical protein
MRFSDTLTGPLLTTAEWLAQHRACLDGDPPTREPYADGWVLLTCLCGSRHLAERDDPDLPTTGESG